MKISNPLLNEHKRHRRYGLALVLILACLMALLDYLMALSVRLEIRQAQLNAATSDLDHQLLPLLHLSTVLQKEAEQRLATPDTSAALPAEAVASLNLSGPQAGAQPLSSAETAMLAQLSPWFRHHLQVTPYLLNITYLSEGGQWFHVRTADPRAAELAQTAKQQIAALAHLQFNSPQANLLILDKLRQRFVLQVPLRQDKTISGHLLLEIDLLAMLQQVKLADHGATLMLMDKNAEVFLATQDGKLTDPSRYDGTDQNDSMQSLAALPVAVHIQPDQVSETKAELTRFAAELGLYCLPLLLLYGYLASRFKRKVLRPFSRLLIHVARLERGDAQGVRHVPAEWEQVFKHTEQLKDQALGKSAD